MNNELEKKAGIIRAVKVTIKLNAKMETILPITKIRSTSNLTFL
jgi:hypothetical protein